MADVPGEESRDEPSGVPLLAQFLSEAQEPEDLVIWGWDRLGLRRVVALRGLRLAAVLFAEEDSSNNKDGNSRIAILGSTYTEELCTSPPDRYTYVWREVDVSLLDLALRFGHYEVARTLNRLGIKSRSLTKKDFQAGTFSNVIDYEKPSGGTHHEELGDWKQDDCRGWARIEKQCEKCRNGGNFLFPEKERAGYCPWPLRQNTDVVGQRASDWDLPVHVARGHVDTPTTRLALAAAAEGELDMLGLDEADAKLRLLDAALLLGHVAAAVVLAELCGQMRPLRIWSLADLVRIRSHEQRLRLASPQYLEAHAAAGAVFKAGEFQFQDHISLSDYTLLELVVRGGHVELASFMKANEPARAFETNFSDPLDLLDFNAGTQTCHVHPAVLDVLDILGIGCSNLKFRNEGLYFPIDCSQCYVAVDLDLRGQSFLFLAMLLCDFRQVARMIVSGADLSSGDSLDQLLNEGSWHQDAFCGPCGVHVSFPYDSSPGLRWTTIEVALSSAFHTALDKVKKCTTTVARGGLVQQMNLMTPLAHKIFVFAAELPTGLQRLRLHCLASLDRDPLSLESVLFDAASSSTEPSNHQADQSPVHASEESAAPLPAAAEEDVPAEEALSKEDDLGLAAAMQQSEAEALSQEQQEVHKALLLSKEETFSNDHVVLWRLTKCSARISDALSTSEELRACHDRVLEAGCELTPKWAGGAVLLVPLTLELYQELGLKFAPYHVLSLSSDRERLLAALMSFPSKKRPTVSSDHRAALLHTGDLSGISGGSGGVGLDQQAFEESDQEENDEVGRSEVSEAEEGRSQRQPPCHTVTTLEIVRTFLDFPLPRDVFEASSSGLVRSAPEVSWGRGEDESRQGNQQCGGGGGGILSSNPRRWGGKSLGRSAGQKKGA